MNAFSKMLDKAVRDGLMSGIRVGPIGDGFAIGASGHLADVRSGGGTVVTGQSRVGNDRDG